MYLTTKAIESSPNGILYLFFTDDSFYIHWPD